MQHDQTKNVEIHRHFIKEKMEEKIKLPYVKSKNQLADILTKAVGMQLFEEALCKLGVGNPTTQLTLRPNLWGEC